MRRFGSVALLPFLLQTLSVLANPLNITGMVPLDHALSNSEEQLDFAGNMTESTVAVQIVGFAHTSPAPIGHILTRVFVVVGALVVFVCLLYASITIHRRCSSESYSYSDDHRILL